MTRSFAIFLINKKVISEVILFMGSAVPKTHSCDFLSLQYHSATFLAKNASFGAISFNPTWDENSSTNFSCSQKSQTSHKTMKVFLYSHPDSAGCCPTLPASVKDALVVSVVLSVCDVVGNAVMRCICSVIMWCM